MPQIQQLLDHKGHQVACIKKEQTVLVAAQKMNELRIGALVVINDDDSIAGIFTERDILTRIVAKEILPSKATVGEFMTTNPVVASPDNTLNECGRLMTERRVRHLPVISDSTVVGLVSIGDLTRHELESQEHEIQNLKDYMYR